MNKIKISAVSYANTFPFILGLEEFMTGNDFELSREIPSACAQKVIDKKANIGLIPVAAIPLVPNAKIISNYCIGSYGAVKTVLIMSKVPLEEIKTIYLDSESKTSITLVKVLAKHYWKKNWQYKILPQDYATNPEVESMVLIGDKTQQKLPFKYHYDLSSAWYGFTGKPFVFAAWVTNANLSEDFIQRFNNALKKGLENIPESIKKYNIDLNYDLEEYLEKYISYNFDNEKQQALDIFLNLIETV